MHTTADITGTTLSAKLSGKADELAALSNVRFRGKADIAALDCHDVIRERA
ncbi:MAG TPA: hypothetical protein VGU64_13745 [Terriglobales bacterium]|nr:hypothetical protein [Terriglobales bacterium]